MGAENGIGEPALGWSADQLGMYSAESIRSGKRRRGASQDPRKKQWHYLSSSLPAVSVWHERA